jgi:uncharacterized protein YjbI with pentapeptide repeats
MKQRQRGLSRRSVIGLIALGLSRVAAFGESKRKLSTRDVVTQLVEARNGMRPDFSDVDLGGLDLADLDFKGADLSDCNLFGVDLTGSNLQGANLARTVMDRATLVRAQFSNANREEASIRRPSVYTDMHLDPADLPLFRKANLTRATFIARLDGANFSGATLSGATFSLRQERDLGGPPTRGLDRCNFSGAAMVGTNLRGLSLTQYVFRDADLSSADLRDADLSYADLRGTVLADARLDGAKLEGAKGVN